MSLAEKECIPCKGGVPPLDEKKIRELISELDGWHAVGNHHLEKEWKFKNYKEAWEKLNRISELAESVNHHPDLHLSWGSLRIEIWTHKIDGLTESDFIFAAKCDRV